MKKLILSFAIVCFVSIAKINAQSAVVNAPAKQATTVTATTNATKVPAAKVETKKASCSHSSKSCCMSKDASSSKKEEKVEKAGEAKTSN